MWWALSLILVAGMLILWLWLRQRKITVTWYAAFMGITGLLLFLFAIHNFIDFRAEYETIAAWNSMLVFGLPAVALLIIAVFLVWWRQFRKAKARGAPDTAAS